MYKLYFLGFTHVSAFAYTKVILHTHSFCQTRNLLSIYICLIPGKCVDQIGCSRKPFLKQASLNSNDQMYFCHSRRDGCVRQNNAQQSFVPRRSTAEITQLHKTGRNWDLLLDHLGEKKKRHKTSLYLWLWKMHYLFICNDNRRLLCNSQSQ